jgi:uncharacterized protein YkwD
MEQGRMWGLRGDSTGQAKAIWLVLALMCAGLIHGPAAAQELSLDAARKLALDLVNKSRAENKLPPLKLETKLTKAAQVHAEDMYKRDYFAHNSPEGKTVSDRFQSAGGNKWLLVAENIAECEGCRTPLQEFLIRQQHTGWMNSPGHRANILRKGLDSFGYGIIVDKTGKLKAVQTFAGPGTPAGTSAADARITSPQQQVEMLAAKINEKRKSAGRKPLQASPSLIATAVNIAPAPGDEKFKLRHSDDPLSAVPAADKEKWQHIGLMTLQCGGCGVQVTAGDMSSFIGQWLGDAKSSKYFLDADYSHFGFTVAADGNGRKTAIVILGGSAR